MSMNKWYYGKHEFTVSFGEFTSDGKGVQSRLALRTYAEGTDFLGCVVEDRYRNTKLKIPISTREKDHYKDIKISADAMIREKERLNGENSKEQQVDG